MGQNSHPGQETEARSKEGWGLGLVCPNGTKAARIVLRGLPERENTDRTNRGWSHQTSWMCALCEGEKGERLLEASQKAVQTKKGWQNGTGILVFRPSSKESIFLSNGSLKSPTRLNQQQTWDLGVYALMDSRDSPWAPGLLRFSAARGL